MWVDDFDGPEGAPPSPESWTAELGGGGWGDEQLQTYTRENARLTGNGCLAITARSDRTSARLTTKGRVTARYGRVEARIKVPAGARRCGPRSGCSAPTSTWRAGRRCGEIDVMEVVGSEPRTVHATRARPGPCGLVGEGIGAPDTMRRGPRRGLPRLRRRLGARAAVTWSWTTSRTSTADARGRAADRGPSTATSTCWSTWPSGAAGPATTATRALPADDPRRLGPRYGAAVADDER